MVKPMSDERLEWFRQQKWIRRLSEGRELLAEIDRLRTENAELKRERSDWRLSARAND